MARRKTRPDRENDESDEGAASFATYLEYNRVLRTWFVAFGVGGPALFLVNSALAQRLVAERKLVLVVTLFLIGAGAQVIGALINKVANWYLYSAAVDVENPSLLKYRIADWLTEQFWIDILFDVLTIAVFGYAAWILLTVFANG